MHRWLAVLGLSIVLVVGTGDLVQQATGLKLQGDGGQPGDAADTCADATTALTVGQLTHGLLIPVDDTVDFYVLPVGTEFVNTTINVSLVAHSDLLQAELTTYTAGCDRDLRDLLEHPGHDNGRGLGHEKCRGAGHTECFIRDIQVGDGWVSFVPVVPQTFVVRAQLHVNLPVALPALPVPAGQAQVPQPGIRACQPFCSEVDGVLGYALNPGAG